MNEITFKEYKKAIKSQFEAKKIEGVYGSGDISNITPAQLRDLCLYIAQKGMTKTDEATFRFFFNANENEKFERAIENFNTGKLKSVISFFKEDKKSENRLRIELAAVIVDFNPRPFKKYCQNRDIQNKDINEKNDQVFSEENNDKIYIESDDLEIVSKNEVIAIENKTKKKIITIAIVLLSLFFTGYTAKNIFFPAKQCMQWKENHYEAVDCSNNQLGIGQMNLIVPIDEQIMKLEKLDPKDTLEFFKNEIPIVWYFKRDGEIELFNQSGFYPETAKPLRPITNYIIQKYKLNSKD